MMNRYIYINITNYINGLTKIFSCLFIVFGIQACSSGIGDRKQNITNGSANEATEHPIQLQKSLLFESTQDPLFYLKLDDLAGSLDLKDELEFLRNTSVEGASFQIDAGKNGGALAFDGLDDRANLGAVDFGGDSVTISLFFKANDFVTVDGRLISKATGVSSRQHYIMLSTYKKKSLRFRLKIGGKTYTLISASGVIDTGKFYHVAARYNGSTMMIFVDGVAVGKLAITGPIDANNTAILSLGNQPKSAGKRAFNGLIDEVKVFKSALTDSDIKELADNVIAPNILPVAHAGVDQLVEDIENDGAELVNLDGSLSSDEDGNIVSVAWLENGLILSTQLVAAVNLGVGDHTLNLVVTDERGGQATDSVLVQVRAPVLPPPPEVSVNSFYFKLDETSGSTSIADELGNLTGAFTEGAIFDEQSGKNGGALSFDGVDDRANLGPVNFAGASLTMSLFMKANSFAVSDARLVSKATGTATNAHFLMISTYGNRALRFRLRTKGLTSTLISSEGILSLNKYHHVAARYDGANMVLFLDGRIVGTMAKTGTIDSDSTIVLSLGNQPQGGGEKPFDGYLDEVRLVDRALSDLEILELAQVEDSGVSLFANAGPDQELLDSNDDGSEEVSLDGSASKLGDGATSIDSYAWNNENGELIASGVLAKAVLSVGSHVLNLRITDNNGSTSSDLVNILVKAFVPPVLVACADGIDNDNDGLIDLDDSDCSSASDNSEFSIGDSSVWTQFSPSLDTEVIYISDSGGDDSLCRSYLASTINEVFNPSSAFVPCKTINAGVTIFNSLSNDRPHWILFKSGDTWVNQNFGKWTKSGRSKLEPAVLASYGTSPNRPAVLTGSSSFSGAVSSGVKYIVLSDLLIHAHTWFSVDGKGGPRAFRWLSGTSSGDWVFEGLHVKSYEIGFLIGGSSEPYRGAISNLTFRNNVISGNQGENAMYITGVNGLKLFEGNTFYDNGYWSNHTEGSFRAKHIYFDNENGYPAGGDPTGHSIFRDNFFVESAAYAFQSRVGGEIYNNYLESNATGIGAGGHDGGQLWPIITTSIHDNVVLHLKDSLHQDLGYGILVENANSTIERNIVAYYNAANNYGHPFYITGNGGNTATCQISNNTIYKAVGDIRGGGDVAPISQENNLINDEMILVSTNIRSSTVSFSDSDLRDLGKYNQEILGGSRDRKAFMQEAMKQWRGYFRPEYSVQEVLRYVREGFTPISGQPGICGKGAVSCSAEP